jgi:CspA family cold shock protein
VFSFFLHGTAKSSRRDDWRSWLCGWRPVRVPLGGVRLAFELLLKGRQGRGKPVATSKAFCFGEVADMPQGTIKKLVSDRGFGFIAGQNGEIFFHHSSVKETSFEALHEGQAVEYEEESGPKGPRAISVKPA